MIKRIIFDIDNTLLDSDKSVFIAVEKTKEYFNIDFSSKKLYQLWEVIEKERLFLNEDKMLTFIENNLSIKLPKNFFNTLHEFYSQEAELLNMETRNIILKLRKKYEIVLLSNWFYDTQVKRLNKVSLLDLFDNIYCIDNLGYKPDKETYIKACYPHRLNECLMVGDNLIYDVKEPVKLGMKALYFNPLNYKSEFRSIKSIDEIEKILKEEI